MHQITITVKKLGRGGRGAIAVAAERIFHSPAGTGPRRSRPRVPRIELELGPLPPPGSKVVHTPPAAPAGPPSIIPDDGAGVALITAEAS